MKTTILSTVLSLALCFMSACVRLQPAQVVVVTATSTPPLSTTEAAPFIANAIIPTSTAVPSLNASAIDLPTATAAYRMYTVQVGDTLSGIASTFEVRLETLLELNQISDPNLIAVGQVILLPGEPNILSPDLEIIPNSSFIRNHESKLFNTASFIDSQNGYVRTAIDTVDGAILTAAEVVERVSQEFSVDPRLLLAILEYKSGWLSQNLDDENFKQYPVQGVPSPDGIDRSGLYKQLAWTANQLNAGYYRWKYNNLSSVEFDDGNRIKLADNLNAATVALQRFFSLNTSYSEWETSLKPEGFYTTYVQLFGEPSPPTPPTVNLVQPELVLPFSKGETWFFTGGAHGGWGSGSAWSAIDFAPPDDREDDGNLCYVSEYWATAVANGVISRSERGMVMLDLDGDGDDTTGWNILYLHIAETDRVELGSVVTVGDRIGHPSCEGGVSTATHMHIARIYNGEWIPVTCEGCLSYTDIPPFRLGDWDVFGLEGQEYQGYMRRDQEWRQAEQGRLTPVNRITW